ncbi:MAG: hypothetical protein JST28_24075 [Acidobacteria bacterium]|nr:hypothetical protein [Acidobacteriota bacterium]
MLRTTFLACATMLAAGVVVPSSPAIAQSTHVAYVYVSDLVSPNTSNKHDLYAYGARADGSLYRVTGTPFNYDIHSLSVNGNYLFGVSGNLIDSYLVSSTGAPQLVGTVDAVSHATNPCGGIGALAVDHSGHNLYGPITEGDCMGISFQNFAISSTSGKLTYKNTSDEAGYGYSGLSFLGNNLFAYTPICNAFDGEAIGRIGAYQRASDGTLKRVAANVGSVSTPSGADSYCPLAIATDPTNHVAVLQQATMGDGTYVGPPNIATYTATSTGDLTTTSTYSNSPRTRTGANVMRMDPSGKLLAVGGANGLDVFHYHGANPITYAKALLTSTPISSVYWDKSNHLYALGNGKLYVFTVTLTGVSQAPGSPHAIPHPDSLIVRATN